MRAKVSVTGGQAVDAYIRQLRERLARKNAVLVGLPKSSGNYEDGTKMAVIGAVQEYGSADGRIPERSFLRVPLRADQKRFAAIFRESIPDVVHGRLTMQQMMDRIGLAAAATAQEAIAAGIEPANAPSTIARKGTSTPLVEKGALKGAITYVIEGDE